MSARLDIATPCRAAFAKRVAALDDETALDAVARGSAGVQGDFRTLWTDLPAANKTAFAVFADEEELLVAVVARDIGGGPMDEHSLEIFFDPRHDHLGWFQFVFIGGRDEILVTHHLPYDEALAASFPMVEPTGHRWYPPPPVEPGEREYPHQRRLALCVRFPLAEVFADGRLCGFNVARSHPRPLEGSSWSPCFGVGFQDASCFGHLSLKTDGGAGDGMEKPPEAPAPNDRFTVGMTVDVPDDVLVSPKPLTPDGLASQFDRLAEVGIGRVHWIDYPPEAKVWSTLDRGGIPSKAAESFKACGDLLPLAARLAHERGMEFIGVHKPFDEAGNYYTVAGPAETAEGGWAREVENRWARLPAAYAEHQEWMMTAHPDLPLRPTRPARALRLYSTTPPAAPAETAVRLWVSRDNRSYAPLDEPVSCRLVGRRRPPSRYTPLGNVSDGDDPDAWCLEIGDMALDTPYVAVEIRQPDLVLSHRAHMLVALVDDEGREWMPTLATDGDVETGFTCWKEWISWCNRSPRLIERVTWGPGVHGLCLDRAGTLPTVPEPAVADVRDHWVARTRRVVESGADGVSLRTLCHHNNIMDYIAYLYHPALVRAFEEEHGRPPTASPEDVAALRRLRGDAYTDYVRAASRAAHAAGKRFGVHLEAGAEIPGSLHTRMELPLQWERWLDEAMVDELTLKWWHPRAPFIAEKVLPKARAAGVAVHVVGRNNCLANTSRRREHVRALVDAARAAGCASYLFYEAAGFMYRDDCNRAVWRGNIGDALKGVSES